MLVRHCLAEAASPCYLLLGIYKSTKAQKLRQSVVPSISLNSQDPWQFRRILPGPVWFNVISYSEALLFRLSDYFGTIQRTARPRALVPTQGILPPYGRKIFK